MADFDGRVVVQRGRRLLRSTSLPVPEGHFSGQHCKPGAGKQEGKWLHHIKNTRIR